MQYSTLQYSTVQYTAVHYSRVQYTTVQSSTGHYSTVQYTTVQYRTPQYSTVQYTTGHHSTVQSSTLQYSTVHHSTLQSSTVQYSTNLLHPWSAATRKTPINASPLEEEFPPSINNSNMPSWRPAGAHSALYKYTLCSRRMLYWSRLIFHHVKSQFYCNAGGAEYCGLTDTTVDWTGLDNGAVVQHYKRWIIRQ